MRFRDLDLNLLVVLDALLAEQNVSRAAERLNLTQPAISNSLARLRVHFNDDLLVKYGRRMVPTPLADRLREPVHDVLLQMQTIADTRPAFDPLTANRTFAIIASDYVAATLLAEAAIRLQTNAPNIGLVTLPLTERNLDSFSRGETDLLISPESAIDGGHRKRFLYREQFTCVAWRENDTIGDTIGLEEYLAQTHVIAAFDDQRMLSFDEAYLKAKGHVRRIGVILQSYTLLPLFVVGTNHLATVHSRIAQRFIETMPIKIVEPRIAFPVVNESLQWHRHIELDPANQWLRSFLLDVASTL